jgi:hypothetical protein
MKPFRIRPYRALGGFLLIYDGWQTWWFPSIGAAMDETKRLGGGNP